MSAGELEDENVVGEFKGEKFPRWERIEIKRKSMWPPNLKKLEIFSQTLSRSNFCHRFFPPRRRSLSLYPDSRIFEKMHTEETFSLCND